MAEKSKSEMHLEFMGGSSGSSPALLVTRFRMKHTRQQSVWGKAACFFFLSDGVFVLGTDILNFGLCKTSLLFIQLVIAYIYPHIHLFPCFSLTLWFSFLFLWGNIFLLLKNFFWYFIHCGFPFLLYNCIMIYSFFAF